MVSAAVDFPQPDSPTRPYDSPGFDVHRDAAQDPPVDPAHAIADLEVGQLERGGRLDDAHRSSTCCTLSETRLTATTSDAIAMPGKSTVHHC